MRFLTVVVMALAMSAAMARRHARQSDGGAVNPIGSVLSQFESLRTQLSGVTNVLAALNRQISGVVQTGIRSVAGLQAEGEETTQAPSSTAVPGQPGFEATSPAIPTGQQQNQTQGVPTSVPSQQQNQTQTGIPGQPQQPSIPGQQQNQTNPSIPTTPTAPSQNNTGIPGVDLGGSIVRSLQDVLGQFGSFGRTLNEITEQFNQIVATSSRLVTGRRKRQGNPLEVITGLLGTLSRQANDITSQLSGLLSGLGGAATGQRGNGQDSGNGLPGAFEGVMGSLTRLVSGATGR